MPRKISITRRRKSRKIPMMTRKISMKNKKKSRMISMNDAKEDIIPEQNSKSY